MNGSHADLETALFPARPVIEWEDVECLLCGGRRSSILVEAPDPVPGAEGLWFAVVQCQECGLCFTNPRPNERTIGQFYSESYRPHLSPARQNKRKWWRLPFLPRRRRMPWSRPPWHGQGRLLDFGCGSGGFLAWMQREGWQVTGVDVSLPAVQRIRGELGLRAFAGSLPHPDLQGEQFDVITMWHALEHVHQPLEVLRAARALLTPGGLLFVEVPNIDSLPFRWFGQRWFGLDLPRHLVHFAPETLQTMLERAGFQVSAMRLKRWSSWLRSSARQAAEHEDGRWWQRLFRHKATSSLLSWYCYLTRQCDCLFVSATPCGAALSVADPHGLPPVGVRRYRPMP